MWDQKVGTKTLEHLLIDKTDMLVIKKRKIFV